MSPISLQECLNKMSKILRFVTAIISPPEERKAPPIISAPTPVSATQTYQDSEGKEYQNQIDRDEAQKRLDRKGKFPAQAGDPAALKQFRIGIGAGKPKVKNPVVATASSGSGITIAGA